MRNPQDFVAPRKNALRYSTTPGNAIGPEPSEEPLEPVQLLESNEYHYKVVLPYPASISRLEPSELFHPDDSSRVTGRLRPALATGRVDIRISLDERTVASGAVEVRSSKLEYLRDYRWMLRDIAGQASELIMERFATAESRFSPDDAADARTLYQRFEFLRSLLSGVQFEEAIQLVLSRPYVQWTEVEESHFPHEGIRQSSQIAKQMSRPGPRVPWPSSPFSFTSLPASFRVGRTEVSVDNPPNRFVKFALGRWRDVVTNVEQILLREQATQPVQRGLQETELLTEKLEAFLAHDVLRDVGELRHFPTGNPVLMNREGYREILRSYIQFETAAKLSWQGGEDVFLAGQRNIAALYEYWIFFEVAAVISQLSDVELDLSPLIRVERDGLALTLSRGEAQNLRGKFNRLGRRLDVHLWFNKTFGRAMSGGSWTRTMRPDVSLLIEGPEDPTFEPVWVHFDAKYRIDTLKEIMGSDDTIADRNDQDVASEPARQATRSDLLTMHAYRDAIRRSAGAYVLYPGDRNEALRAYHELLPGLGAFVLRPSETGESAGRRDLRVFIDDLLTHIASQVTQHERERYWVRVAHATEPRDSRFPAAPFLFRPPADTEILLGYVRSVAHLDWIRRQRLYNLRADGRTGSVGLQSRELAAELLVLRGPSVPQPQVWLIAGPPLLTTKRQMIDRGYPTPRGDLYFCLQLKGMVSERLSYQLSKELIDQIVETRDDGLPSAAPLAVTWLELVT